MSITLSSVVVVIPTLNREWDLRLTLDQLRKQSTTPKIVVIIDSSEKLSDTSKYEQDWKLIHVKSDIQSSAIQRNIGIEILEKYNYDFILFHDDDMDINENYISSLIESLNSHEDACGISGIALDTSLKNNHSWAYRFFIKDILCSRQGIVTRGGINKPVLIRDGSIKESEWLIGCSLWKRFPPNVKFENSLEKYAIFEDVIFSMKMRKILNRKLIVNTGIHIIHRPSTRQKKYTKEIKLNWIKNRHLASQLFPETISKSTMWLVNVMYIFWTLFRIPLNPVRFPRELEGLVKGCLEVVRNGT